ncbi:MAG: hypothetical protein INH37_24365 [Myxococcaceae bacterium]|nr:hypothetical protein [Myxococcaceae bacterium]
MPPDVSLRRRARAGLATVALSIFAAPPALAQPTNREINPAVLGANALPPLANESARVGRDVTAQLGWAGQASTPLGEGVDVSMLVPFRVEVPVAGRVAFAADGSPFELWAYSAQTRDAWEPRRSKGITRADVRLSTKALLWREAGWRPATALRVTLKTATGEDLFTRRFLDAPAYQFDALASWRWALGHVHVEAWLLLGFLAWQQGSIGQNDALAWAGTVMARWSPWALRLEARGYAGWQRGDKPVVLAAQAEATLTSAVDVVLHASRGFADPQLVEVGVSVRLRLPLE